MQLRLYQSLLKYLSRLDLGHAARMGELGDEHVPGAIHIALAGQFASWAGTILGLDEQIILVAEDPQRAITFYSTIFNWKFNKWDGPVDYWTISTGKSPAARPTSPSVRP